MKPLFANPQVGDKVVVIYGSGKTIESTIVDVTPKEIRIATFNLIRFNRSGLLCKPDGRYVRIEPKHMER